MGGWMDGWMGGWMDVKAGLRIAYSNQKVSEIQTVWKQNAGLDFGHSGCSVQKS